MSHQISIVSSTLAVSSRHGKSAHITGTRLVPRPSPRPVFDGLQYTNAEGKAYSVGDVTCDVR